MMNQDMIESLDFMHDYDQSPGYEDFAENLDKAEYAADINTVRGQEHLQRSESEEKNRLLESYFHDLLNYSLLGPAEEKRYSAVMHICRKKADELNEKCSNTDDNSRRSELYRKLYMRKLADKKYNFVKSNLRFVINVSKRFTGRGLPFADLIQEGNIGLMKAVDRFDHKKGFRFTTYASWWIHQSINRAIMKKSNTVAIPVYLQEQKNKVLKSKYKLKDKYGRTPTVDEIAEDSELSQYAVDKITKGYGTRSLDNTISGEDAKTYKDILPDECTPAQDDIMSAHDLRDILSLSLNSLDHKEEEILRLRYGVGIESIYTLQELSQRYNLSQERIRQIEKEALKKIAMSEDGKRLRYYYSR